MNAPASRAFAKLEHALEELRFDVRGLECADFGCNVGGFTDCLLRRGAAKVHALDTAYGLLAWRLRNDPRVVVRERTNALHADPPEGGVDLVVVDLGWTPQRHALPAALRWLRAGPTGAVLTLIKPHYEATARGGAVLRGGLGPETSRQVLAEVVAGIPTLGFRLAGLVESPIPGAKSARSGAGNLEFLALLRPSTASPDPHRDGSPARLDPPMA